MPRTTKEVKIDNEKNDKIKTKKSTTATKKSNTTKKKTTTKKTETKTQKVEAKTNTKKTEPKEKKTTKSTTKKAASNAKKSTGAKSSTVKKETSTVAKKKTTVKKATTTKKKTTTSGTKRNSTTKSKKLYSNVVAEYYDLPYRYNETIVKILYQTPTILFVYWDISDSDREKFIKEYGENFFYNTRPILKIFNLTKNYSFEIEINDFANSWYINVNDANCEYKIELGRRTIKFEENLNTDYIYISSSNNIEFPNDHILLEELPDVIKFRNVKTNEISTKNIGTLHLIGINKIYKVHDFYKKFYKDELLKENIITTSSSSWN